MKSPFVVPVLFLICVIWLVQGKTIKQLQDQNISLKQTIYDLFRSIMKSATHLQNNLVRSLSQIAPAANKFANHISGYAIQQANLKDLPTAKELTKEALSLVPNTKRILAESNKEVKEAMTIGRKETKSAYKDATDILRSVLRN